MVSFSWSRWEPGRQQLAIGASLQVCLTCFVLPAHAALVLSTLPPLPLAAWPIAMLFAGGDGNFWLSFFICTVEHGIAFKVP